MKRIFLIWCLSLFIGGVNAQEKMAEIALSLPGGHVSGVALELNERIVELGVNGEGKVQAKIPVSGGEYARLWIGQGWFPVWLEPDKPWQAKVDNNGAYFEGAGAAINTYLNTKPKNQIERYDYKMDDASFRAKLQKLDEEKKQLLTSSNLDADFTAKELKRIAYTRNYYLASFVIGGGADGTMNLSGDTFSELQQALKEDPDSWGILGYTESLNRVVFAFAKMDETSTTPYAVLLNALKIAMENFKDKRTLEDVVMNAVMEYVGFQGMENTEEMDRIFRQCVTRPDYVEEYERMYADFKRLGKGAPAVPFKFKDINGNEVSLADLKGKYVYVDIWATWCGPCNAEIPKLKELEKKLEGRNICFVSISCDEDKAAWERFVKEKEMGGIQLHFGGDQNFMAMIKCDGIPRFMLIDREGKFIDSNMTRPSEAATWKTLEALPGL